MSTMESPAGKIRLVPDMVRADLLFMSHNSRHHTISPEQVRTLALPDPTARTFRVLTAPNPTVIYNQKSRPVGSEVKLSDINDPLFTIHAVSAFERQKEYPWTKRYSAKLIANMGKDALVLAAYADVLREREETASFQLKLNLMIPKILYATPGFAKRLEVASHSQAARNAGVRALSGFERPTSVTTTHSSLMEALVGQRAFLYQAFEGESVDEAMEQLYGAAPNEASSLYLDAFAGNSDAFNAASTIKRSLPSAGGTD